MPDLLGTFLEFQWQYYAILLGGYLLGSIPFGLVLTRLAGLGDIRKMGSGNIGATNVLRTGNKALAAATLILDGGKGAAAVGIANLWIGHPDIEVMAAAGAILGHIVPVWLKFRGGKGVATALGVLLAVMWPIGALACLAWLAVAAAFRYSSLAALVATAVAPAAAWAVADRGGEILGALVTHQYAELALFVAALVWIRHRTNIKRLVTGDEPRIGGRGRARTEA